MALGARVATGEVKVWRGWPVGEMRVTARVTLAGVGDWLVAVVRTWMVAEAAVTVGVVTKVPQGAMWVAEVVMRRTWRLMPAPGYQREAGCWLVSERTARMLGPGWRQGVRS